MPGIFVHSVGSLVWDEEGKESILSVPGSYWLCHKKNIYKFTLKFHKSIRNTDEFNYSKDLMRVIRRILKCNPPQGQQFSTKNLFIEFNHSTWTRTDKMFAMVKFKEKGAFVYQQAFILTIKVVELVPPDDCLSDNRRQSDLSKSGSDRRSEKCLNVINVSAASSSPGKTDDDKSPTILVESNVEEDPTSPDSEDQVSENEESSNPSTVNQEEKKEEAKIVTSISTTEEDGDIELDKYSDANDLPDLKLTLDSDSEDEVDVRNVTCNNAESSLMKTCTETDKETACENKLEEMQVDSTCLPYQYLIERDIENSRIKCIEKCHDGNASKSDEEDEAVDTPDPMVMQCLDMTDMVMKGLMFTLRQEENSVKIVKQTTKVEVDEVLENSEKVETKEGDPCLLNSSLLKLESMITNIDRSKTSSDLSKLYQSLASLVTEKNQDSFCDDKFETARSSNFGLLDLSSDPVSDLDIPETFQRNLMQVERPEEYEGLVMDDFEKPVTWKTVTNSDVDAESGSTPEEKVVPRPNGPKVISDEIIKSAELPQSWLSMLISSKQSRSDFKNDVLDDFSSVAESKAEEHISEPVAVEAETKTRVLVEASKSCDSNEQNKPSKTVPAVPTDEESSKSWPSSNKSDKGKRRGESLRCDRIVKKKRVNDEMENCISQVTSRRNPKRGVSETRPDYSLKRKRTSLELQKDEKQRSINRDANNKVDICKLIGDLSKGVRVIVDRLDPKTLRN